MPFSGSVTPGMVLVITVSITFHLLIALLANVLMVPLALRLLESQRVEISSIITSTFHDFAKEITLTYFTFLIGSLSILASLMQDTSTRIRTGGSLS